MIFRNLSENFHRPAGIILLTGNGTTTETITCEYQDVSAVTLLEVQEIMFENGIKPEDVLYIDFVLGGDHGVGAFRLSYRVIVTLKDSYVCSTKME